MAKVYAWPPVYAFGPEWTIDAPINSSAAWPSGARYASSAGPARRLASLSVSALACGRHGAGYMEALKRYLDGGQHYVRLVSRRINRGPAYPDALRQSGVLTYSGAPGTWVGPWYTGTVLTATRQSPAFTLQVEGLPPSTTVAWPGEFVTVYRASDQAESTVMVSRPAQSNGSGVANIRTVTEASWSGRINIGTSETAVFAAMGIPRAARPLSGDWFYDWSFREVFASELSGGFEEIDPW